MSRAVMISDGFDPAPTIAGRARLTVTAATELPSGVGAIGIGVPAAGDVNPILGIDRDALAAAGFDGAVGQALAITGSGPLHVAVGVGGPDLDANGARDAAAAFASAASRHESLAVMLRGDGPIRVGAAAQSIVEGILLARYSWQALKTSTSGTPVTAITIVVADEHLAEASAGAARGLNFANAGLLSRDLANCPPAHLTAARIGDLCAENAAAWGLAVELFDRDQLVEMGCGGLLAVNGGSDDEPRMVKMEYRPSGATADTPHVVLVGKGIMYDSGGISLKPSDAVHATMKNDMSGAAAVVGTMSVIAAAGCGVAVTAYLMCTDNMPSGTALKLGDVITMRGGTTVEVINTDAEGRLVMADALVLGAEQKPAAILDIATLTGACMRALGTTLTGVMGNDQPLIERIRVAADATDEPVWQLPLERRYRRELDSDVADMRNLGSANAGAITAALFLAHFVGDVPWAHIDIAGTAQVERVESWRTQGCSGVGARLLLELVTNWGN